LFVGATRLVKSAGSRVVYWC